MDNIAGKSEALAEFLGQATGRKARITAMRPLAGGASRATWRLEVEFAGNGKGESLSLVLRADKGGEIQDEALSREEEFKVLETVHAAGVLAPRPRWLSPEPSPIGVPFFLMDYLPGEAVGRRIVRETAFAQAREALPEQMAEQLARIHGVDTKSAGLSFLPAPESGEAPVQNALRRTFRQLDAMGESHPVLEWARIWLVSNASACQQNVFVHGDFRVGNLLVVPQGLSGVIDWEFAHIGDRHEDIAWPLVRSWRFGNDSLRLGGIAADPEPYFTAYEKASGQTIDRSAIDFWEILGNFRWAVGCISQAHRHFSGQAPSVEFASLGRRTAEMELELLDLIEKKEKAR